MDAYGRGDRASPPKRPSMNARATLATPFGALCVQSDGLAIVASEFRVESRRSVPRTGDALLNEARRQVNAYFKRRLRRFDLPLRFAGTAFQNEVWRAVSDLAFGQVVSYAEVARAVGRPLAHRGVAAAMGRSQLDLFMPAHRVIGSDGTVKGASPQSVRAKLLEFERMNVPLAISTV